jgi:hypothetical protein
MISKSKTICATCKKKEIEVPISIEEFPFNPEEDYFE